MVANKRTTSAGAESADGARRWEQFQATYREHAGAVYSVALGVCGIADATDVAAEVFRRLWRHPSQLDPAPGAMRTSLLQATHSVAADTTLGGRPVAGMSPTASLDAKPGGTGDVNESTEERAATAQLLGMLSDDERNAIITVRYGGCTYREAAAALGMDEGTVKQAIRQGLQRLAATRPRSASTPGVPWPHAPGGEG